MIQEFIKQLEKKEDLDFLSMQSAIELIMTGEVDDLSIEAFLLALNAKGIKEKEIAAAARVMKEKSLKFSLGDGASISSSWRSSTGWRQWSTSIWKAARPLSLALPDIISRNLGSAT